MLSVIRAVSAIAAIATASSVSAATQSITFDLHNSGDAGTLSGNVLTITEGGLTGTFTGLYIDDPFYSGGALSSTATDPISDAHSVERWYNGLGVCGIGDCGRTGDRVHTVDGVGDGGTRTEFVEVGFADDDGAAEVTLTALVFGWIGDFAYGYDGTNGSFEIILDTMGLEGIDLGDSLAYASTATANLKARTSTGLYDLTGVSGLTDSIFGIKAGAYGSWKLKAVTVDYTPAAPVPLPAAGWLILAGVASLAALRRAQRGPAQNAV